MSAPCPLAAELVSALGSPLSDSLAEHVASCVACQRELAELRQVHALLAPPAVEPPSHTLQEIEARVLVRLRAPRSHRVAAGLSILFSVVGTTAALSMALHEHAPQAPLRAALIALLSTGIGLFPFAARLPPLAVVAASLLSLSTVSGAAMLPLRALGCLFVLFGIGAVAAAIPTRLWARRFLHGGAQAAVIGFGGLAVQTALCSVTDAVHVTIIHLLPVLAGYALGVLRTPGAAPR